jgi:hypothetical protein
MSQPQESQIWQQSGTTSVWQWLKVSQVFLVQLSPSSHCAALVQQFGIAVPRQEPPLQDVRLVQTLPSSQNPPSSAGTHTSSDVQAWHVGQNPSLQHERPVRHTPPQQTSPVSQESQAAPAVPHAVTVVPA